MNLRMFISYLVTRLDDRIRDCLNIYYYSFFWREIACTVHLFFGRLLKKGRYPILVLRNHS